MRSIAIPLAAAALISTTIVPAAAAGDVNAGKRLAEMWCSSCHLVSPEQKQATAAVPPFSEIAKRPNFDVARLAFFLLDPHPVMPNMSLTRKEAQDIAAYIKSLR